MKAIKDTGNNLVAALDKHDSVGVLDSYFPACDFFTEFERFDRHCEKLKRNGTNIDYVVVCSPNYLHDAHIRFGLRLGADVICEKPIVLHVHNANALIALANEKQKSVYCILQLRCHHIIKALKESINNTQHYNVVINYHTPRGNWYAYSWKGDEAQSGGIVKNIGIHLLDVLCWLFGTPVTQQTQMLNSTETKFTIQFANATASCNLSIAPENKPLRSITIDDTTITLDESFNQLHTDCYQQILEGNGVTIANTTDALTLANQLSVI